MKKSFSKSFSAIIISTVIFQMPVLAQVKTNFTKEVRPSDFNPTGLASTEHTSERNKVDVKVPKKTRGVERYNKLNIWGNIIPDSFLFHRETLNKNQKAVYDVAYKALMKNEEGATLPVGIPEDEFLDAMYALMYDNPEAFWWDGGYRYWYNADGIITNFIFKNWLDSSELEKKYEEFWNATAPILFYASTLPDDMSKIKYIHDYICLSTEYDTESYEANNTGGKLQTAYSCAVEYKTVCAGYSALFQYYMQNLGIPCAYLSSNGHAWNFLKVNGQYYQMDVTWNDTKQIPPYYNLTHDEMQKIDSHTPAGTSKRIIETHPSTGNQMSYLEYYGALYEGSPYTYQELNYFDYEKNTGTLQPVMIYKNEPEVLSIVKNVDELKAAINRTYGSNYADGTVFPFYVPTREELDNLYNRILENDFNDWKHINSSYQGNGGIINLTLAAPAKDDSQAQTTKDTETVVPKTDDTQTHIKTKTLVAPKDVDTESVVTTKETETQTTTITEPVVTTKITEPQPSKQTQPTKKTLKTLPPRIGDKGPGGGIVFYIDGNKAYECSELLGDANWEKAKTLCTNYRGGGKSDWYLPTKEELNYIYQNLQKPGIINDDTWYWSSSTSIYNFAWIQRSYDGYQTDDHTGTTQSVRAVREFEY
jgi:hypothetical protein